MAFEVSKSFVLLKSDKNSCVKNETRNWDDTSPACSHASSHRANHSQRVRLNVSENPYSSHQTTWQAQCYKRAEAVAVIINPTRFSHIYTHHLGLSAPLGTHYSHFTNTWTIWYQSNHIIYQQSLICNDFLHMDAHSSPHPWKIISDSNTTVE